MSEQARVITDENPDAEVSGKENSGVMEMSDEEKALRARIALIAQKVSVELRGKRMTFPSFERPQNFEKLVARVKQYEQDAPLADERISDAVQDVIGDMAHKKKMKKNPKARRGEPI